MDPTHRIEENGAPLLISCNKTTIPKMYEETIAVAELMNDHIIEQKKSVENVDHDLLELSHLLLRILRCFRKQKRGEYKVGNSVYALIKDKNLKKYTNCLRDTKELKLKNERRCLRKYFILLLDFLSISLSSRLVR